MVAGSETLVNLEKGQEKGYLLHLPQLVYVLSPNMRSAWSERNIKKSLCFTALLLGKCQPPVSTYYVTLRFPATLKEAIYAGFIFVSFVWPCLHLIFVSSPKNLAILSLKFDWRGRISFACSINRWIRLPQFQSLWKPVNLFSTWVMILTSASLFYSYFSRHIILAYCTIMVQWRYFLSRDKIRRCVP